MKETKTGSSFAIFLGGLLLLSLSLGLAAKDEKDKRKTPPVFALIAGTVFRPPGFAFPGVKVRIEPEQEKVGELKLKAEQVTTDSRGEFAVRVPAVPAKWRIDVQAKGFRSEPKSVSIEGEQRFDLSFMLEPEAQTKGVTK